MEERTVKSGKKSSQDSSIRKRRLRLDKVDISCKKRKLIQGKTIEVMNQNSNAPESVEPDHRPETFCQYGLAHLKSKKKIKKHFVKEIESLFESQIFMFMT